MIRTGVTVTVIGAALWLLGTLWGDTGPSVGANIGAGLLVLAAILITGCGVVLLLVAALRSWWKRRSGP